MCKQPLWEVQLVAGVPLDATDSYTLAFTIIVALYLARAVALLPAGSMPRIYSNEEL